MASMEAGRGWVIAHQLQAAADAKSAAGRYAVGADAGPWPRVGPDANAGASAIARRWPPATPPPSLWLAGRPGPGGRRRWLAFTQLRQFETGRHAWPFDPGFATIADGTRSRPRGRATRRPAGRSRATGRGITVAGGTLRLRNDDPEGGVGVRQIWRLDATEPRAFRLSATVAQRGDRRAMRPGFRVGEVTLVADGDIERTYFHPMHRLAGLRGTQARRRAMSSSSGFPSGCTQVELAIRLRHATGELRVCDLELRGAGASGPGSRGLRLGPAARLGRDCWPPACWLFARGVDHRAQRAWPWRWRPVAGLMLLMMPEGMRDSTLIRLADLSAAQLVADRRAGRGSVIS